VIVTVASYTVVLVLAVELAVWGAFLTGARVFGFPLPVAALVAAVGNVSLGIAGASVLRRRLGAIVPGVVWLGIALTLGSRKTEGDVVVGGDLRGLAYLLVGTIAAAAVVGVAGARPRTVAVGATPEAPVGR
jgi:hypothetical protein